MIEFEPHCFFGETASNPTKNTIEKIIYLVILYLLLYSIKNILIYEIKW